MRPEFFTIPAPTGAAPHLLVFGGSQGARLFNTHLPRIARPLLEAVPGLTILHQSGLRNFESTQAAYEASGADAARWQVQAFVNDMPAQFARAHLVLTRSGASTVGEEAAAGKPALLIPFAAAADNHQRRNAEAMVAAGAAVMLQENELRNSRQAAGHATALLTDPARLAAMSAAARKQAHPGAAERIADRLAELAKQRYGGPRGRDPSASRSVRPIEKARLPKQTGLFPYQYSGLTGVRHHHRGPPSATAVEATAATAMETTAAATAGISAGGYPPPRITAYAATCITARAAGISAGAVNHIHAA